MNAKTGGKSKRRAILLISATLAFLLLALALIPIWNAQRAKRHLETVSPLATTSLDPDPWPIGAGRELAKRFQPYQRYWTWCLRRASEN